MSLQGGSMSFQETAPSAMKLRDQTVAPVSASISMLCQDAAWGSIFRRPASLLSPSTLKRRFSVASWGIYSCRLSAAALWRQSSI